ncbi:hypothetical protein [Nonomuraea guangzhouensis]|uniref:Uncharacterized protein n=1 Tax=Nonomuraea guangzhouensis TaxID=1291555 RepID=A0ABW4GRC4_9ACTN|nr:hypothetical protein [Nonomuraea guangzhouensis]
MTVFAYGTRARMARSRTTTLTASAPSEGPVDPQQQPTSGVSGLVENLQPVAPSGDRVGERVAAARDGDGLTARVLVGLGGADGHLQAVRDLTHVLPGQRDELAAPALQRQAEHEQQPVAPADRGGQVAGGDHGAQREGAPSGGWRGGDGL